MTPIATYHLRSYRVGLVLITTLALSLLPSCTELIECLEQETLCTEKQQRDSESSKEICGEYMVMDNNLPGSQSSNYMLTIGMTEIESGLPYTSILEEESNLPYAFMITNIGNNSFHSSLMIRVKRPYPKHYEIELMSSKIHLGTETWQVSGSGTIDDGYLEIDLTLDNGTDTRECSIRNF